MTADPLLTQIANRGRLDTQRNFCACGLAATGDEPIPQAGEEPEKSVNTQVHNLQVWSYARTGLMLIGAYVVIKFIYTKYIKK